MEYYRCVAGREVGTAPDLFGADDRGLLTTPPAPQAELDVNFAKSIGPDYWEKRKNVFDYQQDVTSFLNQGKMRTYVHDPQVTFKGPAIQVRSDQVERVAAWIRFKTVPAGLDAGYYSYAYPYQRLEIKGPRTKSPRCR